MIRNVFNETAEDARKFLLRASSFSSIGLPKYYDFHKILVELQNEYEKGWYLEKKKDGRSFFVKSPNGTVINGGDASKLDDVNYCIYSNKDGKYDWRPLQIMNPFIYVVLVNEITKEDNWEIIRDRMGRLQRDKRIHCLSLPISTIDGDNAEKEDVINNWWREVEQQSLKMSLRYNCFLQTDITNCYGSLYTHTITWALHGKKKGKMSKGDLLGDKIDTVIRWSTNNQTNGIPQGNILMDMIAELVLAYADAHLSSAILFYNHKNQHNRIKDFRIMRYRDDYRIYTKTPEDAVKIANLLTVVLADLNFKINTQKTFVSEKMITDAIKQDKYYWLKAKNEKRSLQKHLLLIHSLSEEHPNSGSLNKALTKYLKRIYPLAVFQDTDSEVLISILVDIAYHNPRTYSVVMVILGKILSLEVKTSKIIETLELIEKKFESIPNTEYLQIWLQRLTIVLDRDRKYSSRICQTTYDKKVSLWNNTWLHSDFKKIIDNIPIVDEDVIKTLTLIPSDEEVDFLETKYL